MKRNLLLLNLILAAGIAACIIAVRDRWQQAEQRRQEVIASRRTAPSTAPSAGVASPEPPPRAASYFDVAQQMLFSKDRNPTVVIEVKEEKPMPSLPAAHGVMDIGAGPVVFLSDKQTPQRGYRVGESIGPFKLTAANNQELTLEWEGQTVKRRLEELRPKLDAQAVAAPAAPAPAATSPAPATVSASPARPDPASASPTTNTSNQAPRMGPEAGSASMRYCTPGDPTPDGTVVDGFTKRSRQTPFGSVCFWEKQ